jgi:hypothetical protein
MLQCVVAKVPGLAQSESGSAARFALGTTECSTNHVARRYYGSTPNVLPQDAAANGFNNLQCYWLGLDPINPRSTFKVHATRQPGTGYPLITWDSVGGKTYAVQYAGNLALASTGFTQALTWTETNMPAGVEGRATFVDDYTLTGGPPGPDGRYYRIRWVGPSAYSLRGQVLSQAGGAGGIRCSTSTPDPIAP